MSDQLQFGAERGGTFPLERWPPALFVSQRGKDTRPGSHSWNPSLWTSSPTGALLLNHSWLDARLLSMERPGSSLDGGPAPAPTAPS